MQYLPRRALLLALLTSPALAQDPIPVLESGDLVPGVGNVTMIERLSVNDLGQWIVSARTDSANPDVDSVVLDETGLRLQEGQALSAPAGVQLRNVYDLSLGRDGVLAVVCSLTGPGQTPAGCLYLDTSPLLLPDDVLTHPSATPGTIVVQALWARRGNQGHVTTMSWLDDPTVSGTAEYALLSTDPAGVTSVRVQKGDLLPGQTSPVQFVAVEPYQLDIDGERGAAFVVRLANQDDVVYLDDGQSLTVLAQEGDPSPIPGRNWSNLSSASVATNELGQVAYAGFLGGPGPSGLLVLDGQKFVQHGDSLPAVAPFQMVGIGGLGSSPLRLARTGDLLWRGQWDDPDLTKDAGLFLGHELILQEGVSTVGGVVIEQLRNNFQMSGNGRWILFEADMADGTNGAYLLDRGLGGPVAGCAPALPNSTGQVGRLSLTGVDAPGGQPLRLFAWDLPTDEFGYFLLSRTTSSVPFPGGSQGILCLGGNVGRFAAQVASSGPAGYLEIGVDTTAVPVNPVAPILSGETWTFQAWHRDLDPTPTSNFTEAVSVTFQ